MTTESRGKLIEFTSSNSTTSFIIEATEVDDRDRVQQATGYTEKQFDKLLDRVKPFCESLIDSIQSLRNKPKSISAEFGLNVTAEGNIFVVKATGQATIKVTLNWDN